MRFGAALVSGEVREVLTAFELLYSFRVLDVDLPRPRRGAATDDSLSLGRVVESLLRAWVRKQFYFEAVPVVLYAARSA